MSTLLVNQFAGLLVQQVNLSVLHAEINQHVVDQRRRDIGGLVVTPQLRRRIVGDVSLAVRLQRDDRSTFRRGDDDNPVARGGRGDETQRRIVLRLRVQIAAAPQFVAVLQIVSHDEVRSVGEQEFRLAVVVHHRRGVRVLVLGNRIAWSITLPDFLAGFLVQANNHRLTRLRVAVTVNELQIQLVAIEQRGRGHAKLDVELAVTILQIEFPDFLPIGGPATDDAVGHHRPDMLAIGARRVRRRVTFIATDILVAGCHDLPPLLLAVCPDAQQQQIARTLIDRREKNPLAPHHRSRSGRPWQRQSPGDVLRLRPLRRRVRLIRDAIVLRPSPLRPVLRTNGVEGHRPSHQCDNNESRPSS